MSLKFTREGIDYQIIDLGVEIFETNCFTVAIFPYVCWKAGWYPSHVIPLVTTLQMCQALSSDMGNRHLA